ncbi:4'-phosphopantetheinyl transferase family protein [Dongia rigui]|uniref:4'-phosphopantetheinyl transferase superfamily protein n=1 Tax=Dongia rigui TaxID=940149 RepID=A0ABU5E158_9PROT|nr:4'-phosphopantetheinyl transferase superfamily protein [Dongia rigui]MDY0873323.1 4'-phosphopantetheinyl transferase superfamily protein [Dongia rigui]
MSPTVYFTVIDDVARQNRSALGKIILLQCIRLATQQPNGLFEMTHEPAGRPVVSGHPEIFISLSHSATSLACAGTLAGPLGIDLEIERSGRNVADIAAFAFGPAEQKRVARDGTDGFYRIWTLREAIAKAEGIGLVQVADRQDRVDTGPDSGEWRWRDWHLARHVVAPGRHLALAVQAARADAMAWRYFTPTDA